MSLTIFNFKKVIPMNIRLASLFLFFLLSVFSSQALAQNYPRGFDLRVGIGASVMYNDITVKVLSTSVKEKERYMGINTNISVGWRWKYVGLYLDQDLGGIWRTQTLNIDRFLDESFEPLSDANSKKRFLAGTYFLVRFFIPFNDQAFISIAAGIGQTYNTGSSDIWHKTKKFAGSGLAFKLQLQTTFFVTSFMGLGLTLEIVGTDSSEKGIFLPDPEIPGLKNRVTMAYDIYIFQPGVHVNFNF